MAESYYDNEWTAVLPSAAGSQIALQNDCPAELSISLNNPPYMIDTIPVLEATKGLPFNLGIVRPADVTWPLDIPSEYTFIRIPIYLFDDYESNYPITVVEDGWSEENFPGTLRFNK